MINNYHTKRFSIGFTSIRNPRACIFSRDWLPPHFSTLITGCQHLANSQSPGHHLSRNHSLALKMAEASINPSSSSLEDDYDLSKPISSTTGLRHGLTSYGDAHFSLFLRKVFIKALGYSEDALSRPIIGIINTYSAL